MFKLDKELKDGRDGDNKLLKLFVLDTLDSEMESE